MVFDYCRATAEGLEILVKVAPKAKENKIIGFTPQGLKVRVTVAPEKGQANAAVISLLAKACDVAKTYVTLLAGETSASKRILIRGNSQEFLEKLENICRS